MPDVPVVLAPGLRLWSCGASVCEYVIHGKGKSGSMNQARLCGVIQPNLILPVPVSPDSTEICMRSGNDGILLQAQQEINPSYWSWWHYIWSPVRRRRESVVSSCFLGWEHVSTMASCTQVVKSWCWNCWASSKLESRANAPVDIVKQGLQEVVQSSKTTSSKKESYHPPTSSSKWRGIPGKYLPTHANTLMYALYSPHVSQQDGRNQNAGFMQPTTRTRQPHHPIPELPLSELRAANLGKSHEFPLRLFFCPRTIVACSFATMRRRGH